MALLDRQPQQRMVSGCCRASWASCHDLIHGMKLSCPCVSVLSLITFHWDLAAIYITYCLPLPASNAAGRISTFGAMGSDSLAMYLYIKHGVQSAGLPSQGHACLQ